MQVLYLSVQFWQTCGESAVPVLLFYLGVVYAKYSEACAEIYVDFGEVFEVVGADLDLLQHIVNQSWSVAIHSGSVAIFCGSVSIFIVHQRYASILVMGSAEDWYQ